MKPKDRFNQHMDGGGEIVAPAYMAELVREDGFQLRRSQTLRDACGQQQYRTANSEDARFEQRRRGENLHLAARFERRRGTPHAAQGARTYEPAEENRCETERPYGKQRFGKHVRVM